MAEIAKWSLAQVGNPKASCVPLFFDDGMNLNEIEILKDIAKNQPATYIIVPPSWVESWGTPRELMVIHHWWVVTGVDQR